MEFTKPEKLILWMLCDIYEKLGITDGLDPKFIREAISSGDTWALEWKYTGVFSGSEPSEEIIQEVVQILNMWTQIEGSYAKPSDPDRDRLAAEAEVNRDAKFRGFDGNNEAYHLGVANTLIKDLDRFADFRGRDLNAHMPTIDAHRRMLRASSP